MYSYLFAKVCNFLCSYVPPRYVKFIVFLLEVYYPNYCNMSLISCDLSHLCCCCILLVFSDFFRRGLLVHNCMNSFLACIFMSLLVFLLLNLLEHLKYGLQSVWNVDMC